MLAISRAGAHPGRLNFSLKDLSLPSPPAAFQNIRLTDPSISSIIQNHHQRGTFRYLHPFVEPISDLLFKIDDQIPFFEGSTAVW